MPPKPAYALSRWLGWAARCRIPEFVTLGRRIRAHLPAIHATINHRLSNGLIESVNTKIRLLTRMAFGFHNPHALIGLAMLAVGGLRPALPGDHHQPNSAVSFMVTRGPQTHRADAVGGSPAVR